MSERHEDHDGSDIFWPGYVDATTNLILNLLFLLTILIIAVFMFALELGRTTPIKPETSTKSALEQELAVEPVASTNAALQEATAPLLEEVIDPLKENIELKVEIERLKMLLAQLSSAETRAGGLMKAVDASSRVPSPLQGLDKAIVSDLEVVVRFKDDAITFTAAERAELLKALQPIVTAGKPKIQVDVPAGFSEARRMGFYRAMAVRNLLIEMNLPQENIEISVLEGKSETNASLVRVRSR